MSDMQGREGWKTDQDTDANKRIEHGEVPRDDVLRGVEQRNGECANKDSRVQPRYPSCHQRLSVRIQPNSIEELTALIRKPHLPLHLHRARHLLRHPHLWRQCTNRMIIPDSRPLSLLIPFSLRDGISAQVSFGSSQLGKRC